MTVRSAPRGWSPGPGRPPTTATRRAARRRQRLGEFGLMGPAILVVLGVLFYPLVYSLWLSLTERSDTGRTFGFGNYAAMFGDPILPTALRNTFLFAVIAIAGSIILGLAMALLLNIPSPLRGAARVAMLIPWSMSQVAVAVIWGWIYNGSYGALNGLLFDLGLIDGYRAWLNDGTTAFVLLGTAFIWSIAPYATLIFLSGLQAIPKEQYEAAKIDQANVLQRFRYVTLPWLRNSFAVVFVVASLEGFLAFSLIYMLTNGGPGYETTVLAWWGYATMFTYGATEKGAAILYFLTAMVMAVSLVYMRALRRPAV
ncbi:carbohydrate ABC transporter permease [Micromonospora craniellae]|uniref:Sugar ABC transporter permease n=1 Tax=Micromonospora craniellae TaxID=2294034 RepID=A0A372FST0_9ACTN|nr:sugar ABC transporter permease [Micromonospora craniellae]QOC92285.1 sugar ABC transporter permease [Micromonospora craniellae]RFS43636.1 sugar ABC transporter permease [Micromonospora craniellae]